MNTRNRLVLLCAGLLGALALTACSGGGGGGANNPPPGSTGSDATWDQTNWDEADWI